MIRLNEQQKKITKKLVNGQIKSINDFCDKMFTSVVYDPKTHSEQTVIDIFIYDDNEIAHTLSRTFRFLIQDYIELGFITTTKAPFIPKYKP